MIWHQIQAAKDKRDLIVILLGHDITNNMENLNKTSLPEKLKRWCLQFGLLQQTMCSGVIDKSQ